MMERRELMKHFIDSKGEVSIYELFAEFSDKSEMTIRRDLKYLDEIGAIIRTHGGARTTKQFQGPLEPLYSIRESENIALKERIANLAVKFIEEGRSIFIDAGTTAMALTSVLPDKNYTILTTAPNVALHIATSKNSCSVLLAGGNLNRKTLCCSGYGSTELIKSLNIDIAFIATSGFSKEGGFTTGDYFECEIKKMVIAKSTNRILLMDSSKIGKNMPYTFSMPSDINYLITDKGLSKEYKELFESQGVNIIQ